MAKQLCSLCGKKPGLFTAFPVIEGRAYCKSCYAQTFDRPNAPHPIPDDCWGKKIDVDDLTRINQTLLLRIKALRPSRLHVLCILSHAQNSVAMNKAETLLAVDEYSGRLAKVFANMTTDPESRSDITVIPITYEEYLAEIARLPGFLREFLEEYTPGMADYKSIYAPQDTSAQSLFRVLEGDATTELFLVSGVRVHYALCDTAAYRAWRDTKKNLVDALNDLYFFWKQHKHALRYENKSVWKNEKSIILRDGIAAIRAKGTPADRQSANCVYTQNSNALQEEYFLPTDLDRAMLDMIRDHVS